MSAQQVTPPGSAAASTTSVAGLVSAPSEIVRLPQELAARLLQGLRTVILSGTVTGQGADGALQVRSQFGEIAVRTGVSVSADRQISLQIPPLTGHAAKLTPAQLSRQPIPASLLLPRPATPASSGPTATATAPATAAATPSGTATVANAPVSPAGGPAAPNVPASSGPTIGPSPISSPPPAQSPSGQGASGTAPPAATQPTPQAVPPPAPPGASPQPGNTARAAPTLPSQPSAPVAEPAAGRSPSAATGASTTPAAESGGRPAPAMPPPLGRLAMATQLLTQSGGQTATGAAPPPSQGLAPQAPQAQGATPQLVTGATQQPAAAGVTGAGPAPTTEAAIGGARIAATTVQDLASSPASGRESPRDAIPIDSVRRVPVLREAVAVLSAADPTLATQFVRSVLPQANTQLASTLLFFLAATRGGDVRGWMGGRVATALEETGRADLMPKLAAELSVPARTAPDSVAGEWRSQPIPLYQDGEVGGMAVHVRRSGEDGGADGDGGEDGRRFLLDVDLSRMGPLQFDGLIRDRRFDLVIRSKAAFPDSMRQDIRTLFRDASEAVGLRGGLTFQAGSHDWVTVATARGAE